MNIYEKRLSRLERITRCIGCGDPQFFTSAASFPVNGKTGILYIDTTGNTIYEWNGAIYESLSGSSEGGSSTWGGILGTLSNQTDLQNALNLKAPLASPTFTGTVSGITPSMVGLGNVDNTSDANKPISTATQTALNTKWSLTGNSLTGTEFIGSTNAQPLKFFTNNVERLIITEDGALGIGTSTPGAIVDIIQNGNGFSGPFVRNSDGRPNAGAGISFLTNSFSKIGKNGSGNSFKNLKVSSLIMYNSFAGGIDFLNEANSNISFLSSDVATVATMVITPNLNVGIGTITPLISSILDLTSSTKGLLIPRMTTTQRDAISSPATGLQVYNTTTNALNYYNGTIWTAVGGGASGTEVYNEVTTGITGTTLSVSNTPTAGTLRLFKNGVRLILGTQYTILGATITLTDPAIASDDFIKDYKY